jgi:hypothetical protein
MTPDERVADAVALVQRIQASLAASRLIEGDPDSVTDVEAETPAANTPLPADISEATANSRPPANKPAANTAPVSTEPSANAPDRKAYMRELMRKRRARQKEQP